MASCAELSGGVNVMSTLQLALTVIPPEQLLDMEYEPSSGLRSAVTAPIDALPLLVSVTKLLLESPTLTLPKSRLLFEMVTSGVLVPPCPLRFTLTTVLPCGSINSRVAL